MNPRSVTARSAAAVYFFEKQSRDLAERGLDGLSVMADEEVNRGVVGPLRIFLAGDEEVQALSIPQVVLHGVVGEAAVKVDLRARWQVQGHLPQPVDIGPRAGRKAVFDGAVGLVGHHEDLDAVEILTF